MESSTKAVLALAVVMTMVLCAVSLTPSDTDGANVPDKDDAIAQADDKYYTTVDEALQAVQDGGTLTLLDDADVTQTTINKSVTIDLNGFTLNLKYDNSGNGVGLAFTSGTSVIKNGTILDSRSNGNTLGGLIAIRAINSGTILTFEDVDVRQFVPNNSDAYNYGVRVDAQATITLDSRTTIGEVEQTLTVESAGTCGAVIFGNNSGQTTLNINGATIKASAFAISGNGSSSDGTVINITAGTITSENAPAIYHPQNGVLNISGGTITGATGIEVRSGTVNITGGTIVGNGNPFESDPNGNGSTTTGAGIAIVQHTTKNSIDVSISGGDISGYRAVYESNLQNNEQTDIEKIDISITGGNFEAINGGTEAVLVDDKEIIGDIVSGGTFKGSLDESLITPGVDFAVNPDGSIGVGADIVKDEPSNPSYDDDELPPFIPIQPKDSGDDVTIVACAAAAVVAALMAVFLIVSYKKE